MHVLDHDGDALCVDGAEVGVLKEVDEVGFCGFLEGLDGEGLEAELGPVLLGDLADEALEGQLADEKVAGLLELADFAEGDGAGTEAVGLLDALGTHGVSSLAGLADVGKGGSSGIGLVGLPGSLRSELLAGGLSSSGLVGGLLGAGHCCCLLCGLCDLGVIGGVYIV